MVKPCVLTFSLLLLAQELLIRLSTRVFFLNNVASEGLAAKIVPLPQKLIAKRRKCDSFAVDGTVFVSFRQGLQNSVYVVELELQYNLGSRRIHLGVMDNAVTGEHVCGR